MMIKGVAIIFSLLLLGEWVSGYFGLTLPGNVVGFILMFLLLQLKALKLVHVSQVADGLIRNLGLLFVPLIALSPLSFVHLQDEWFILVAAAAISLPITMVVTGWVVQSLYGLKRNV